MYLSRIAINKGRRKSRQALAYPQMLHAAVLNSFPPGVKESADSRSGRILWRADYFGDSTWLYVLSETKPDFNHIIEQFGWPESEQRWDCGDYTPLLNRIEPGQIWTFRLHANPVRTVKDKHYAHVTVEQQKNWLIARAARNGFSIPEIESAEESYPTLEVIYRNTLRFKKTASDNALVTLAVATFQGQLRVEDADIFRAALCTGIGRARAYGCGLLTLAKE
jgi:CRISPR system Cascade subunit CasE